MGVALVVAVVCARSGAAQAAVARGWAVDSTVGVKVFVPEGRVRVIGWARDSVAVSGTVGQGARVVFAGTRAAVKISVEDGAAWLTVYVPRTGTASIKAASGDIDAHDVSGWFYSVSGHVRVDGAARTVEAESISGALEVSVNASWVRARTASGQLRLGGRVEDASASSVDGAVVVTTTGVASGRFGSVTGPVSIAADPGATGVIDADSYSGTVEFDVPPALQGVCVLTSVAGAIESELPSVRPVSGPGGRGQQLTVRFGDGAGARVTVRTLHGTIRLRRFG